MSPDPVLCRTAFLPTPCTPLGLQHQLATSEGFDQWHRICCVLSALSRVRPRTAPPAIARGPEERPIALANPCILAIVDENAAHNVCCQRGPWHLDASLRASAGGLLTGLRSD